MGSPHLTTVHLPLPLSRVTEELHRALATKHRQDSFQGRDSKGSPKKRVDVGLSRTCSVERGKEREEAWSFDGASDHLCMKCSLGISNFLEEISSLSHTVVFLSFFALCT